MSSLRLDRTEDFEVALVVLVAPVVPVVQMRSSFFSLLKRKITLKAKEIPLPIMPHLLKAEKG